MSHSTVIIGVGNEFRSDDGVGRIAARRLAEKAPKDVSVRESSGEFLSLMELWKDRTRVFLIDAASGGRPGEVLRYDTRTRSLPPSVFSTSTHAFSIAEAIEMARTLGQLPPATIVYGIGGENFAHGELLSPCAEHGCREAVARILGELASGSIRKTTMTSQENRTFESRS